MKRDPLKGVTQNICSILIDMSRKKEIEKQLFNYFLVKNPQLGRFNLLPKYIRK